MRERPILFSGAMVRSILEGCKTQTRRVLRPPPSGDTPEQRNIFPPCVDHPEHWYFRDGYYAEPQQEVGRYVRCPYGVPGDRLWVKETWWHHKQCPPDADLHDDCLLYADSEAAHAYEPGRWIAEWYHKRPSIFMPGWASRIDLEIVAVRVERVQEISEADARAEGIEGGEDAENWGRFCYRKLWDSLNLKRGFGWDANPWVWVIEFRRLDTSDP